MTQNQTPPPWSKDAEMSVLSSMLREVGVIPDVVRVLRREQFYADAHQKFFVSLVELWDAKKPIDLTLLADDLKRRGWFQDVGGYPALVKLLDAAPTSSHVMAYAALVRDKSVLRDLLHCAAGIQRAVLDRGASSADLLAQAESDVFSLFDSGAERCVATAREAVDSYGSQLEERAVSGNVGLPTGYRHLDQVITAMRQSEFILVGARPSAGKTAFGVGVAWHAVKRCATPTLFISLEQSRDELMERLIASIARIDTKELQRADLTGEQWGRVQDARHEIAAVPLFIDDAGSQTMMRIAATARRARRKDKIGLLVVDYLGLIEPENPRASREQQVAAISRRLKSLAKELKIPVLCLAQLNRLSEHRTDKRPRLADFRDSGACEQDADKAILLHRPENVSVNGPHSPVELVVAKNRNGPTGECTLAFYRSHVRFDEYDAAMDFRFDRNARSVQILELPLKAATDALHACGLGDFDAREQWAKDVTALPDAALDGLDEGIEEDMQAFDALNKMRDQTSDR